MLEGDPKDAARLHAQLEQGVRVAIATGRLRPGDQLPTVRQLAVDLRVNANTVAKVYLALERDGVVETKRGVGTFIAEAQTRRGNAAQRERQLAALADRFLAEAAAQGFSSRELMQQLARRMKEGA